MQATRPADVDRLPWLEPYRDTKAAGRPLPKRGYGKPLLAGFGLALLLAFGAGGYWLGQRTDQNPPPARTQTVPVGPAKPAPAPVQVAEAPPPAAEPDREAVAEPKAPVKAAKSRLAKKRVVHRSPPRRKIRTAGLQHEHIDAVRARQERLAKSRPWPRMPSPGPAGQVIQLGAFSSATRANTAYRQRISRYPLLARMPKVVVPVITKPDGRILYVLRLGTTSRQQSKIVCRNLRASGDHCLVIG
jgi:hypothetical protein